MTVAMVDGALIAMSGPDQGMKSMVKIPEADQVIRNVPDVSV